MQKPIEGSIRIGTFHAQTAITKEVVIAFYAPSTALLWNAAVEANNIFISVST
jgi:hypothetical protein